MNKPYEISERLSAEDDTIINYIGKMLLENIIIIEGSKNSDGFLKKLLKRFQINSERTSSCIFSIGSEELFKKHFKELHKEAINVLKELSEYR